MEHPEEGSVDKDNSNHQYCVEIKERGGSKCEPNYSFDARPRSEFLNAVSWLGAARVNSDVSHLK